MDIKKAISEEFDNYVKATFPKDSIRNFLLNHERRHILSKNLKREIDRSSHILLPMDKTQEEKRILIRGVVQNLAKAFCTHALENKKAELQKSTLTLEKAVEKFNAGEYSDDDLLIST